ncbi:hypothetical protein C0991_004230 [Blastosporella zonata]|nr:hypothetical protein C0991_004230 [Blastosporella zonata]
MSFSPAHHTKHLPVLVCPTPRATFHLTQSDDGISNGTALWLGAQCLSAYLATLNRPPGSLVELGSGIGLTALVMASLGWRVLATDIPHVISSVLSPNILTNLHRLPPASGSIQVSELDWTIPPDAWIWNSPSAIASASLTTSHTNTQQPPFDLICTADTVYTPALIQPLLRSLHALCTLSIAAAPSARPPPVYLCLERRDPVLADRCLADAHDTWGFHLERIPPRKIAKAIQKAAMNWPKEDWEGIEIWKLTLPRG